MVAFAVLAAGAGIVSGTAGAQTVDTEGTVSFSGPPLLGVELTATLNDPDADVVIQSWGWVRQDGDDPFSPTENIIGARSASYTPTAADAGKLLSAWVRYDDEHGEDHYLLPIAGVVSWRRVLVSTLDQPDSPSTLVVASTSQGRQRFTTGSHAGGYVVHRVGVRLGTTLAGSLGSLGIYEQSGPHTLGDLVATLTAPASFVIGVNWFTVPDGTDASLDAGTTYALAFSSANRLHTTESDDEDAGGVAGWSVENTLPTGIATPLVNNFALRVRVEGHVKSGAGGEAPGALGGVSASWAGGAATLSWVGLSDVTVLGYEVRHRRVGASRWGVWAEVADSDGDGDRSDETTTTVSGVAGGAFYEFEVRAVSNFGDGAAARVVADASPLLVSNVGQTAESSLTELHLQQFGTGANVGGYTLSSVEVAIDEAETATARVRVLSDGTDDSTVNPADVVATLVERGTKGTADGHRTRVFAPRAVTVLDADATYYLEIVSTDTDQQLRIDRVGVASGQDTGGSAGWTLGSRYGRTSPLTATDFAWGTAADKAAKVTINGYPITAPAFDGDTAAREVDENAASGTVGLPVAATDADGDAVAYSLAATADSDADAHLAAFRRDFALDAATGQISVRPGARIDYETRPAYKVVLQATDREDVNGDPEATPAVDDTVTLTVTVVNLDEPGAVTFDGRPVVGRALTASVTDPDGAVTSPSWQWSVAAMPTDAFVDIPLETDPSYTPRLADRGFFLRATVSYTDPQGASKTASATTATRPEYITQPQFASDAYTATFDEIFEPVAEDTRALGPARYSFLDPDGDVVRFGVSATSDPDGAEHLAAFRRDFGFGGPPQFGEVRTLFLRRGRVMDFETRPSYKVLLQVTDGEDADGNPEATPTVDDTLTLTINVVDVDEDGTVSLSSGPFYGVPLTATLDDPDVPLSGQSWQWSRSDTADGIYVDIAGATEPVYTPTAEDDAAMWLRVSVSYSDKFSPPVKTLGATTAAAARTRPVRTAPVVIPRSGGGGGGGGDTDVGVATFVVANGWSPPDVGVASVLAARTDSAVVLYTAPDELSAETAALMAEASPAEVIIVGGTDAVSRDVRTAMRAASPQSDIERVSGEGRADTAAVAARRVLGSPAGAGRVTLVIANGWSPPDIGAAAALAARSGRAAVLYTAPDALPDASAAVLRDYDTARVLIVGGTAAVTDTVQAQIAKAADDAAVSRITGADRTHTAAAAARRTLGNPAGLPDGLTIVIANGWSPPDIGVAAALAASLDNAAVAYTDPHTLPEATAALLNDYRPSRVVIIGGPAAVTNDIRTAITTTTPDTSTRRITGTTRTDTAARTAKQILTQN